MVMKYFDELSDLEMALIRLDTVESILRSITESELQYEDVQRIVWHVYDLVDEINKESKENFYKLWDKIRDDTFASKDNMTGDLFANDKKEYSFEKLNDVVRSWVYASEK
jgi:hypothetical protein